MKNIGKTAGLLGLGALLIALNLSGAAGCGSSSDNGGGGSSSVTAAQANDMGSAGTTAALEAISVALSSSSSGALTTSSNGDLRVAIKNAITVAQTGSCAQGSLPTLGSGSSSVVVNGSDIQCSGGSVGSGSCTVGFSESSLASSTELVVTMDCTNLVVPVEPNSGTACQNVTLDGSLGLDATISSAGSTTTDDISLTSNNLTVTLPDATSCGVNYNFTETVSVDGNTGAGTVSANGCMSACGDAFSVSGSDTFN